VLATPRRWRPPLCQPPPSVCLFPDYEPRTLLRLSTYPFEPPLAVFPLQPPRHHQAPRWRRRRRGSAGVSWSATGSTQTTSRKMQRRIRGSTPIILNLFAMIVAADWCDFEWDAFSFHFLQEERKDRRRRRQSGRGEQTAEAAVTPAKVEEPRETHKMLQVWAETVPLFWVVHCQQLYQLVLQNHTRI
jgi:hypothetical protein